MRVGAMLARDDLASAGRGISVGKDRTSAPAGASGEIVPLARKH